MKKTSLFAGILGLVLAAGVVAPVFADDAAPAEKDPITALADKYKEAVNNAQKEVEKDEAAKKAEELDALKKSFVAPEVLDYMKNVRDSKEEEKSIFDANAKDILGSEPRFAYDQIIANLRKDPELVKKNLASDEQLLGYKAILEKAFREHGGFDKEDKEFLAKLEKDIVDERVLTYLRDWIKTGKLPNGQTVPGTTNGNPTLPETGEELPYVAVALLGMAAAFTAIRRARKVNEL